MESAPSEGERKRLRKFVALVDEMSRSRFIETYRKQSHKISFGSGVDEFPKYDRTDFESFLTRFRQVAVLESDKTYWKTAFGIAGKYASPQLRPELAKATDFLKKLLMNKQWTGIQLGFPSEDGSADLLLSSHQILNALLYGWVIHSEDLHEREAAILRETEVWQYLFPLLLEIVIPSLKTFIWFFKVIRKDGILKDEEYPAHCITQKND